MPILIGEQMKPRSAPVTDAVSMRQQDFVEEDVPSASARVEQRRICRNRPQPMRRDRAVEASPPGMHELSARRCVDTDAIAAEALRNLAAVQSVRRLTFDRTI